MFSVLRLRHIPHRYSCTGARDRQHTPSNDLFIPECLCKRAEGTRHAYTHAHARTGMDGHMNPQTHSIMLNRRSFSDTHVLKRTRTARGIGRFFSQPNDLRRGYVAFRALLETTQPGHTFPPPPRCNHSPKPLTALPSIQRMHSCPAFPFSTTPH